MVKKLVQLKDMKQVEVFNRICSEFDCDMDLVKGKYYVDAKSIMGIFSLNLSSPVELVADTENESAVNEAFQEFIIEQE